MAEVEETMDKFAALKRAKEEDQQLPDGYWGADHPKCPHCGFVCDINTNDWWRLFEEGEHEVSCPQCDGDFSVTTRVSYSFDTYEQEDAEFSGAARRPPGTPS